MMSPEERQKTYEQHAEGRARYSSRISDTTKYIWAGGLAIFFALATSEPGSVSHRLFESERWLIWVLAISAGFALVCELAQFVCAYLHEQQVCSFLVKNRNLDKKQFNEFLNTSALARFNRTLFVLKIVFSAVTGVALVSALLGFLLQQR